MKSLGIIIVLAAGVLAIVLALVPLGVTTDIVAAPQRGDTTAGNLRVAEITVRNDGIFTRTIALPQLAACAGDQRVPIDAYVGAQGTLVRGAGQIPTISITPGEQGTVYLVTRESGFYETIRLYRETKGFSCITATNPIATSTPVAE